MNIISVPYVPTCTDYAPVLNKILSEKCDDAVIKLEKGDYPILSPVKIENRENLTIDGGVFEKLMYPVVYAASADNLTIRNNILKDCPKYEPGDILLHCCNDVKISGNKRYETGEELSVKILSDSDLAKL